MDFCDVVGVYQDYHLYFGSDETNFHVIVSLEDKNLCSSMCLNNYSEVERLSSKIKRRIDEEIERQTPKPKSLEDAIALSKAFDWVTWHVVQPSGLIGHYKGKKLDIRHHDLDFYVLYYADEKFTFSKTHSFLLVSRDIKLRIDAFTPRSSYIQIGY